MDLTKMTKTTIGIMSGSCCVERTQTNKENVHTKRYSHYGCSILHQAATNGCVNCLRWCVDELDGDVDLCDNYGDTPLHNAARHNQTKCVKFLLSRGASVNILNSRGRTPFSISVLNNLPIGISLEEQDNPDHKKIIAVFCAPQFATHVDDLRPEFFTHGVKIATMLIDKGAGIRRGKVSQNVCEIAVGRENCKRVCTILFGIRRERCTILDTNARDIIRLIADMIWSTRFENHWFPKSR